MCPNLTPDLTPGLPRAADMSSSFLYASSQPVGFWVLGTIIHRGCGQKWAAQIKVNVVLGPIRISESKMQYSSYLAPGQGRAGEDLTSTVVIMGGASGVMSTSSALWLYPVCVHAPGAGVEEGGQGVHGKFVLPSSIKL